MDPAVKTNLNGINTLTRRVNELKAELGSVKDQIDSLDIDPIVENVKVNSKTIKLNATRIKTQKDLDLDSKINKLKIEIKKLDAKISNILSGVESNKNDLKIQLALIAEVKIAITENANAIQTNEIDIKVNAGKNKDTLGSIEVVSTKVIETEEQVSKLQEDLATNNKVTDGCIIGIDTNVSKIKDVSLVVLKNREFIEENIKDIKTNNDSIIKNAKNVELNSVQTKTNSDNVRMLRK